MVSDYSALDASFVVRLLGAMKKKRGAPVYMFTFLLPLLLLLLLLYSQKREDEEQGNNSDCIIAIGYCYDQECVDMSNEYISSYYIINRGSIIYFMSY